ncbi:MAG: lipid-A-disaccharide synthase [Bacteroidales bacterium]|nr:lipid-A-disaccharide synthase [Bacteroidales bacterium]
MRYYIVAGEASGDLHGSNLMRGIYAEDPEADIRFWGGGLMDAVYKEHQQGSGLVQDYREGAIIGYWEVLIHARKLLGKVQRCKEDILKWNPHVVILIDYPGFNFKIAEFAHDAGFKVFYYIAPKVWASREGRIRKLKAWVDKLFIVFPFEVPYFEAKGVPFVYKGNPLVDAIDSSPAMKESRSDFLQRCSLPDKPYIALLAGSRNGEISTMMPVLMSFCSDLHKLPQYADYHFVIAAAPSRTAADYDLAGNEEFVHLVFGETYAALRHAKAAVINSGTASLEAALIGTPQVVGYRTASLTYLIMRTIIKIKYISLANLIIDRPAFKEYLQDYLRSDIIVDEVRRILEDHFYRSRMLKDYEEIRSLLGGSGASNAVARAMIDELRLYY